MTMGKPVKQSQATKLVDLAVAQEVEFFHTPDGEVYGEITCHDHRENWPLHTKAFRRWLASLYFKESHTVPSAQALADALAVLAAHAQFEGDERPVYTRLAQFQDCLYLDLGDPLWRAIRIDAHGWKLWNAPPVAFRRTPSMLELPVPQRGGSLDALHGLLNIAEDEWPLVAGWLVMALHPKGPYPVLVLSGEHGTGKTWIARTLKQLLDPATVEDRGAPKSVRDLMIGACNGWILSFDNLSHLTPDMSDAICRLSTGAGFSTRELYSNTDEIILKATRPQIINSIGDIVTRADLLDRSLIINPHFLCEDNRRDLKDLHQQLAKQHPVILGALLDAVVQGMKAVDGITLVRKPRMADFARWVAACEPALRLQHAFLDVYEVNRTEAIEIALEASPLVPVLRQLVESPLAPTWEGSPSDLLTALNRVATDDQKTNKAWPGGAHILSRRLLQIAPALRHIGFHVSASKTGTEGRIITITKEPKIASPASPASPAMGNGAASSDARDASDAKNGPPLYGGDPRQGEDYDLELD